MTVAFAFLFSFVGGWVTERSVECITVQHLSTTKVLYLEFCRFGRKPAILVASVVFTIGSVVMAVSPNKSVRDQFGKKVKNVKN